MDSDWEIIETAELGHQDKIDFPESLRDEIAQDNPLRGETVVWHVDRVTGTMLIANEELPEDRYPDGGRTKVYQDNKRIRPRKKVKDSVDEDLAKGDTLVYLAHGHMLSSTQKCAYVLTEEQCFDLIEAGEFGDRLLVEKLRELFS